MKYSDGDKVWINNDEYTGPGIVVLTKHFDLSEVKSVDFKFDMQEDYYVCCITKCGEDDFIACNGSEVIDLEER
jgi:hypothetical protein